MKHSTKKFKLNLITGAYITALFMAFAFKPATVDTGLHWFSYNESTQSVGDYIGTSSSELSAKGCPSEMEEVMCALGFSEENVDFNEENAPSPIIGSSQTALQASDEQRFRPEL